MNDFLSRQLSVARDYIRGYRNGDICLNSLILGVEGVGEVIGSSPWRKAVFPIVFEMEQINAVALDENRALTDAENASVESSILALEEVINYFDGV